MNAPIRELPPAARPADITPEEWALRLELAACYRLFAHLGWTEMIFNHITLRVPGDEPHFLINPYGLHYSEVTARNLVKIDLDGNVIGTSAYPINPAGFVIHSAIHRHRHDAHCIIHTHTTAGIAVACKADGLAYDNFYSAQFWGRVAYHDFEGVTTDLAEQQRLVASLGNADVLILRNHGLLVVGPSVPEAFIESWSLQRACEVQLAAGSIPGPNQRIPESVLRAIPAQRKPMQAGHTRPYQPVFDAMLRVAGIRLEDVAGHSKRRRGSQLTELKTVDTCRALRHRAADRPGADGRRAARRARDRGQQRRRPRLAAVRDARRRGAGEGARRDPRGHREALQRQLLLPRAAGRGRCARACMAHGAGAVLRGVRHRCGEHRRRSRARAVQRRGRRRAREFKPAVVSFHFGLPAPICSRGCARGARRSSRRRRRSTRRAGSRRRGVDAIIAQGVEAGGHRGMFLTDDLTTQVGTFALLPQVVRAVKVPVIAAGGIADADGVAAALALGAAGVQVGTAYLLCPEATTSAIHRRALASDAAAHTALTNLFTGRPARGIVNRLMRELGPVRRRRRSRSRPRRSRRCARRPRRAAAATSRRSGPARTSAAARPCRPRS